MRWAALFALALPSGCICVPSYYYDNTGGIRSEITYKTGKKDGPRVEYPRNGKIRARFGNKAGVFDGDYVSYDEEGRKEYTGTFKDGSLVGGTGKRWGFDEVSGKDVHVGDWDGKRGIFFQTED